jgi:hypothetical protein
MRQILCWQALEDRCAVRIASINRAKMGQECDGQSERLGRTSLSMLRLTGI